MGLNKTAFASIDAKARELAGEMPQAVKAVTRLSAATGLGGATVVSWSEAGEKRLKLLADHISDRRKWVKEHATLPMFVMDKEWRLQASNAMRALKVACLASLDEVMRVLALPDGGQQVRKAGEEMFEAAYEIIWEKLQHSLAAIDEEARSSTKKAGWGIVAKYGWPALVYALGFASSHYWPKLEAVVKLLRNP